MLFQRTLAAMSAALLFLTMAAGVAHADAKPTPTRLLVITGEETAIYLRSIPSTGYQWTVTPAKGSGILSLDKGAWVPSKAGVPGAPGWQVFRTKATDEGLTTLTFQYARPFDKNTPPARTFVLVVRAEPKTSATVTSSQVFYCQPDDEVKVTLPCSTDGAQWAIIPRSYDGGVLLSQGSTTAPATAKTPASITFRLKAVGVGNTKATLTCAKEGVQPEAVNTTAVRVER